MVLVYTLTSMLSAFLVFAIQPVVAKIALPTLGGIPAVWNGCMLFFQATLLMGYLYAHVLTGWSKTKLQPAVHIMLLLLAVSIFPMGFEGKTGLDPVYSPLLWLLLMLLYSVGLPFFAISASAPLLQRWFSHTGHQDAHNPYFLYAASNIGSMGALLLYPFVIEPNIGMIEQVRVWEQGVMVLFVFFIAVGYFLFVRAKPDVMVEPEVSSHEVSDIDSSPVTWSRRVRWIVLSFVPSSLLYGVTAYISTDIASFPLLWIIPLTLYLITFIIVFGKKLKVVEAAKELHLPVVLLLMFVIGIKTQSLFALAVHVAAFFVITLAVHGELSKSKPLPQKLTEFFLWMSLGGVFGGVFNTLLAPHLFNSVIEYPLMLLVSCLLYMPGRAISGQLLIYGKKIVPVAVLAFILLYFLLEYLGTTSGPNDIASIRFIVFPVAAIAAYFTYNLYKDYAAAFVLCIGLLGGWLHAVSEWREGDVLFQERSLFGVNKVTSADNGQWRMFIHGTTLHGVQSQISGQELAPVSYYTPLKQVFNGMPEALRGEPVALLGLGAGTIACYGEKEQLFDLYEIDPLVKEIAENERYFTYMRDCPPEKVVILGDARQKVSFQPDNKYGLMILDAFSSDAIPTHLITKEAIELYFQKMHNNGIAAFHVSNRHIDLTVVLAAIAADLGLEGKMLRHEPSEDQEWVFPSLWVVLARKHDAIDAIVNAEDGWKALPAFHSKALWTDNFSNVVSSLVWSKDKIGE